MNCTTELARIVTEHPDLPIIPYVYSGVVAEDNYGFWVGAPTHVSLENYTLGYYFDPYYGSTDRYYKEDEKDDLIEEIAEHKYAGTPGDYERAEQEVSQIEWKPGIFLWIGLPESSHDNLSEGKLLMLLGSKKERLNIALVNTHPPA